MPIDVPTARQFVYGASGHGSAVAIGYLTSSGTNGVAVGYNARNSNSNCIAIGMNSGSGVGTYNVSIGGNAKGQNNGSIAIGWYSRTYIQDCVGFDGTGIENNSNYGAQRTLLLYDPTKVFFRNEVMVAEKTAIANYTAGHYLSEYIQNNTLVQESGTNKFYLTFTDSNNYTTFIKNVASGTATAIDKKVNGVHITVLLSTDAVVGLDLLLYDTNGHLSYGICDSSASVISAYIDSDGVVIVNPPTGVTVASVKYYLR